MSQSHELHGSDSDSVFHLPPYYYFFFFLFFLQADFHNTRPALYKDQKTTQIKQKNTD